MYVVVWVMVMLLCAPVMARAQDAHEHMAHDAGDGAPPATRDGSGTAWLPDESPMYAMHRQAGAWMAMVHASVFLQYLHESGPRGSDQGGSINWVMGMAERKAGTGRLRLRGMLSAEPWTIPGCGYPNLLATGEICDGLPIHDRQHPHDLLMELAAKYDRPLGRGVRLELYGGPAGEPALGPVAFMHRVSALANPIAPISHHWFDSTHVTFGVATAGVYGQKWKAETSLFNGREPDERRWDLDFGAMNSISGRVWFLPTPQWSLQMSAGHLADAEDAGVGVARVDVNRVTASATFHRTTLERTWWATTVGWGRNAEHLDVPTHAVFAESSVTLNDRDAFYVRGEWAQKTLHALYVFAPDILDLAKLQGGYTRYLRPRGGLTPGVGGTISTGLVPDSLVPEYGRRGNLGVGVYLTLRPAVHE